MNARPVAVVTGASRGLGRDVAAALADAGARVAEVARTAERFPCDVSQLDEVERLRARVEAELGPPQILVNAAGIFGPVEPLTRSAPERWVETVLVDLIGPYLTCRAFAPPLDRLQRIQRLAGGTHLGRALGRGVERDDGHDHEAGQAQGHDAAEDLLLLGDRALADQRKAAADVVGRVAALDARLAEVRHLRRGGLGDDRRVEGGGLLHRRHFQRHEARGKVRPSGDLRPRVLGY